MFELFVTLACASTPAPPAVTVAESTGGEVHMLCFKNIYVFPTMIYSFITASASHDCPYFWTLRLDQAGSSASMATTPSSSSKI